jgi:hypothetical protein
VKSGLDELPSPNHNPKKYGSNGSTFSGSSNGLFTGTLYLYSIPF